MKKKIMVVDDSALMRRAFCDIINEDEFFEVVDQAKDGVEAYEKIKSNKFDAVILDINMPRMNGLELLKKLQNEKINVVIVVASTTTKAGSKETFEALSLGAVDFITKPENIIEAKGSAFTYDILGMLRAVLKLDIDTSANANKPQTNKTQESQKSTEAEKKPQTEFKKTPEVKPVEAKPSKPLNVEEKITPTPAPTPLKPTGTPKVSPIKSDNKLIALACSTGGPKSLQEVIPFLPKGMNAPMVLVQHMPSGFTKSLAERLDEISKVSVKEAEEGDVLEKGHVYIAPGGKHLMVVKKPSGEHMIHLDNSPAIGGLKPCADIMYDSLIESSYDEIVCVVLTGMGQDGTKGIDDLSRSKKIFTISQDEASCVVYGMPRAIKNAGLSDIVVPLKEVASTIITNVGVR